MEDEYLFLMSSWLRAATSSHLKSSLAAATGSLGSQPTLGRILCGGLLHARRPVLEAAKELVYMFMALDLKFAPPSSVDHKSLHSTTTTSTNHQRLALYANRKFFREMEKFRPSSPNPYRSMHAQLRRIAQILPTLCYLQPLQNFYNS
ncbi:hypothetical protein NPIL_664041 [Nephila pilipes]|uniref:Uncharacterized protein n=1 Tax=Nephila pilipes TaxID=299642 RepID=A0A8X6TDE6_NEPPI|nr:hypothetical protein NPIL_664041 [Nephila pilipes]